MSADLLVPGSHRISALVDDTAVVAAMLRTQAAWAQSLGAVGVATPDQVAWIVAATHEPFDLPRLATDGEAAGNPVVPLVRELRSRVTDPAASKLVHRGLTSQDVLDTALILISRDVLRHIVSDLGESSDALAGLARRYRDAPMVGRTLTQYAVPITFGLKAAQWLSGVLDALELVERVDGGLPAQCGGAAGTMSLMVELTGTATGLAEAFAQELGLSTPDLPWHTRRTPVTILGDALVAVTDALGVIATNVLLLSRPEIAEVQEGSVPGRGGSSTMPHKQNPVLSILIRSASLQAPLLGAQLHLAAAQSVDERPDGAWHAEWPALRALLLLAGTAANQAAELLRGIQVNASTMSDRAHAAAADLLAERDGSAPRDATDPDGPEDVTTYLGAAGELVDRALRRHTTTRTHS